MILFAFLYSENINFGNAIIGDAERNEICEGCEEDIFDDYIENGKQVISIKGKKPASIEELKLYSFVKMSEPSGEFIFKVDYSNLQNTDAMAGILLREPGNEAVDYIAVGYTNEQYFEYRYSINGENDSHKPCGYGFDNREVYIKVVINSNLAKFYIAPEPFENIADWRWIGRRFHIKNNVLIGPCLLPGNESGSIDEVRFTDFQNELEGTLLEPVLERQLIINRDLSALLNDFKNNHVSRMQNDQFYKDLFDNMALHFQIFKQSIKPINEYMPDLQKIENSNYNLRLYIEDIVLSEIITGRPREFNLSDYELDISFEMPALFNKIQNCISACDELLGDGWKEFYSHFFNPWVQIFRPVWYAKAFSCINTYNDAAAAVVAMHHQINNADALFLESAACITNFTLLVYLDEAARDKYETGLGGYVTAVKSMMEICDEIYQFNNIPLKAYSAIALYEVLNGYNGTLFAIDVCIDELFTEAGAYGEGTGYLNYVYQELLPLYYLTLYTGYISKDDINSRFLNSGNWLLNIADKSGVIPPVDDAVEIIPWIAPFFAFNDDYRFIDYTEKFLPFPTFNHNAMIRFLTYPVKHVESFSGTKTPFTVNNISCSEGVGKIHFTQGDDEVSITLIGEGEDELTKGKTHDGQDNGSLIINRLVSSTGDVDHLVIDPGYGGFDRKTETSLFEYHNNFRIDGKGQSVNGTWSEGEMKALVRKTFSINSDAIVDEVYGQVKGVIEGSSPYNSSGGSAAVTVPLQHGITTSFVYDALVDNGPSPEGSRTVFIYDGEIIILDKIRRGAPVTGACNFNKCSVRYNLPANSTVANGVVSGVSESGNTDIRMCVFNNNRSIKINPLFNNYDFIQQSGANKTGINYIFQEDYNPDNFWYSNYNIFITIIETKNSSDNFSSGVYEYSTDNEFPAFLCVKKHLPVNNIDRYIFLNGFFKDGINALADIGIIEFKNNKLFNAVLMKIDHNVMSLVEDGTSLVDETSGDKMSFSLKEVFDNYTINTDQNISSNKPLILRNMNIVPPAHVTFQGNDYIYILPETVIKKGSEAVFTMINN